MKSGIPITPLREIVLVGGGNMGFALLDGWLSRKDGLSVHVVEPSIELRERARAAGAAVYAEARELNRDMVPQVIVVAVKPQLVCRLLSEYQVFIDRGALVLSVAAGVTIGDMQSVLGSAAAIVRCMPNTPAAVGAGAVVCCTNPAAQDEGRRIAHVLLETSGDIYFVENEALMDAVTALSGSGPAYVFHFIECLADAGEKAGLPTDLAKALALQTAYGASLLARKSSLAPDKLRQEVTSPNGTTAAGLSVLMADGGLGLLMEKTVRAAKLRSVELRHN